MHLSHRPDNAEVDNLMWRVIQSAQQDPTLRQGVLKDHPAPWMRLRDAGAKPPPICEPTTSQQSKRRLLIIRSAMAHLHVPTTAAVLSLQQQGWMLQGQGCCLGGPPASHKLAGWSASWMSP